jgi:hypothetical protein
VQQLAWHDDININEQKVVEKYQITLSMETLLDLLTVSIEEVTGQLKAVNDRKEGPPANPVSVDGK